MSYKDVFSRNRRGNFLGKLNRTNPSGLFFGEMDTFIETILSTSPLSVWLTTDKRRRDRFSHKHRGNTATCMWMCAAPPLPMPFVHAGTCFPNRPVYRHLYRCPPRSRRRTGYSYLLILYRYTFLLLLFYNITIHTYTHTHV